MRPIHPEAADHEVWIGNMFACDVPKVGWTTKRWGTAAYDTSGTRLAPANFVPVFVARAEIEAAGVEIPDSGVIDHRW